MQNSANTQNNRWKGMKGMIIIEIAETNAEIPQINDEILVMLFFYFMLFPKSKVITVDIILQGPIRVMPKMKIVTQYSHGFVKKNETMHIRIELVSSIGLKSNDLLLYLSTKKPSIRAPIMLPQSIIAEIYPFCSFIRSPFWLRKVGNQKYNPQTQAFKQAHPMAQDNTLGQPSNENIPYLFQELFQLLSLFNNYLCKFQFFQSLNQLELFECYFVSSIKQKIKIDVVIPSNPADRQLQIHEQECLSRVLQIVEEQMFPTLPLNANIATSTPCFLSLNHLPKIPMSPGHPVA